jgi:hypothetical protein
MMRAVFPKDPTQARFEVQFSNWHLNPATKDADFTCCRAEGAADGFRAP